MLDIYDSNGRLLPDEQRVFKFGLFLRNTSLDELPQLINIIKGDLSLIGPRPLLESYLPYYTKREKLRHSVTPGITGWAQINGRNQLEWDARLEMDAWYAENCCLTLDTKIFFLTILKVLKRDGVQANSQQLTPVLLSEIRKTSLDNPI